jgi:hypothetical protein
MKRRGAFGLQPLGDFAGRGRHSADARTERRLKACWALVVGSSLEKRTRLIGVRNGILVLGCWESTLIPSLRASAEASWPHVRERLERLLKVRLGSISVVPCDPPEAKVARCEEPGDPLAKVLDRYRSLAKELWQNRAQ